MTERMTIGGMMVPNTATIIPIKPSTCQPTRIAALTAIAPGEDCANAVISSISCSSIQCSSSTNFFFIKVTMTKPPPKVKLLMYSVLKNSFQSRANRVPYVLFSSIQVFFSFFDFRTTIFVFLLFQTAFNCYCLRKPVFSGILVLRTAKHGGNLYET